MPFDGIVLKSVVDELNQTVINGKINKITQPERDEIILHIRSNSQNYKLLISANSGFSRIHLTTSSKENPSSPPMFCMLLRKHIQSGKIIMVESHDFERILTIHIEGIDELGDVNTKRLVVEIMDRHSNILLINSNNTIIDCIKHIDSDVNRVRELMPARPYIFPPEQNKVSILDLDEESYIQRINILSDMKISKYLLSTLKGFSVFACNNLCLCSDINPDTPLKSLSENDLQKLKKGILTIKEALKLSAYTPTLIFDAQSKDYLDYHCLPIIKNIKSETLSSISETIDKFYYERDKTQRMSQKCADITRLLNNNIDRCKKKIAIHNKTLIESSDREKYQLYGELITANMYSITKGLSSVTLQNYYCEDNSSIDIPLDNTKTPQQNAQAYFKKYNKLKASQQYAQKQLDLIKEEIEYLENVLYSSENCTSVVELDLIRDELTSQGYIKTKISINTKKKKSNLTLEPYKYTSSDGFDILVGRNNTQNDKLTLKIAHFNDIWLHTKNTPGSHVIIKKMGNEVPDSTLIEAAQLAAWYSKARQAPKVEVDYTEVRNVKKPNGAKPGMVIYIKYRTLIIVPKER